MTPHPDHAFTPGPVTAFTPGPVLAFTPGPVHVREDVLRAMATQPLPHRSPAFRAVVRRVQDGLAQFLGTSAAVVPVLASATAAFDAALAGIARERVLVLVNGSFGERWAVAAAGMGLRTETLALPFGQAFTADIVERALERDARRASGIPPIDTVVLVHSETSTGALSDLAGIARAVRARPGTALLVDAVSSLGVVPIDVDTLGEEALLLASTGKGLACPPGMAVLVVAPGAAARARRAPTGPVAMRLENLLAAAARGETPHTPATSLFHALDVQVAHLLAEGMPARAARHESLARMTREWAEGRFLPLAEEGFRSPAVTVFENVRIDRPEGGPVDVPAVLAGLEERGFRIADGHGPLAGATFRIGHLGDVDAAGLRACLRALDAVLGT